MPGFVLQNLVASNSTIYLIISLQIKENRRKQKELKMLQHYNMYVHSFSFNEFYCDKF